MNKCMLQSTNNSKRTPDCFNRRSVPAQAGTGISEVDPARTVSYKFYENFNTSANKQVSVRM